MLFECVDSMVLLIYTVNRLWEVYAEVETLGISYYAELPFYPRNDLRRNLGLLVILYDGICDVPFFLAYGEFNRDLCRISYRRRLLMILRWLILMYGGLADFRAWRELTGFRGLSRMLHQLGGSPAWVSSGCIGLRLVRTSTYDGVCGVMVPLIMCVYGACNAENTAQVLFFFHGANDMARVCVSGAVWSP